MKYEVRHTWTDRTEGFRPTHDAANPWVIVGVSELGSLHIVSRHVSKAQARRKANRLNEGCKDD